MSNQQEHEATGQLLNFDDSSNQPNQPNQENFFNDGLEFTESGFSPYDLSFDLTSNFGLPDTSFDRYSTSLESQSQSNDNYQEGNSNQLEMKATEPHHSQELSKDLFLTYRYMARILSNPNLVMHLSNVWSKPIEQMFKHYLKLNNFTNLNEVKLRIDELLNKTMRLDEQLRHVYMRFTSYLLDQFDQTNPEIGLKALAQQPQLKKTRLLQCYQSNFKLPLETAIRISDCQSGFSISKLQTMKDTSRTLFLEFTNYLKYQYEADDEKCFDQYFSSMTRKQTNFRQKPRNPHAVTATRNAILELIQKKIK
jgi:hypothetical protein